MKTLSLTPRDHYSSFSQALFRVEYLHETSKECKTVLVPLISFEEGKKVQE